MFSKIMIKDVTADNEVFILQWLSHEWTIQKKKQNDRM